MDLDKFGDRLISSVKQYVKGAFDAVNDRVNYLEKRLNEFPIPKDGKDGSDGKDGINGVDGKNGIDGKDGAPGRDGKDGKDGIDGSFGLSGADGKNGKDGKDGADGLPGKDGRDGLDGKDGAPGMDGKDGRDGIDGKNGENGKDGLNGQDGKDGAPGRDLDPKAVYAMICEVVDDFLPQALSKAIESAAGGIAAKAAALIPPPQNGRDGRDGAPGKDGKDGSPGRDGEKGANGLDGMSLHNFDVEILDGGRTFVMKLIRGDEVVSHEFTLAVPLDRGIYKQGAEYEQGDGVTYGGSWWIAQRQTTDIPGKSDAWRLAVKRGQDGKDLRKASGS